MDKAHIHRFDQEEIEVLNRVITMVRGFDALGSFAGFVSKSITWLGIVIGGYVALKSGAVDFIMGVVGSKG